MSSMSFRQTHAILADAIRDLRAGRLFWLALIVSTVLPLALLPIGINENGLTVFHWELDAPINTGTTTLGNLYLAVIAIIGIPLWLTWGATIVALVSTSGMIPSFVASGSVEFSLAKPIGRVRLFLTKWAGGLLFAAAQVGVFCLSAFLVVWIRGGMFAPEILLAIPIVLSMFAYLHAISALFGMLTGSGNAAMLMTIGVWFALFVVAATEASFLQQRAQREVALERAEEKIEVREEFARRKLERDGVSPPYSREQMLEVNPTIEWAEDEADRLRPAVETWTTWHERLSLVRAPLPKTGETTDLLGRWIVDTDDAQRLMFMGAEEDDEIDESPEDEDETARRGGPTRAEVERAVELATKPAWWILGTSYAFTGVVLGICCLIFARRDF
ncbi:MAG: ABC transporter permease [Planctomycetota bacterium]